MAIKILIVDDNAAVRSALRACLEADPRVIICGEAKDGRAAVEAADTLHPDVVILDVSMPVMNGLEAARKMAGMSPKPQVVLFTAHEGEILQEDLRSLGVKTVVSKNDRYMVKHLRESVLSPSTSAEISC